MIATTRKVTVTTLQHSIPHLEGSHFYLYRKNRRANISQSTVPVPDASADGTELLGKYPRQGLRPVLVFLHGGGWMGGHAAYHPCAGTCFALALLKDWIIVSVDYRRAPKHSLPTVVSDARDTIRYRRSRRWIDHRPIIAAPCMRACVRACVRSR